MLLAGETATQKTGLRCWRAWGRLPLRWLLSAREIIASSFMRQGGLQTADRKEPRCPALARLIEERFHISASKKLLPQYRR